MRISQFIQELQKARTVYGDREIIVRVGKRRYPIAQDRMAINTVTGHVSFAAVVNPLFMQGGKMDQQIKLTKIADYLANRKSPMSPDNPKEIKEFVKQFDIKESELGPILKLVRLDYILREVLGQISEYEGKGGESD